MQSGHNIEKVREKMRELTKSLCCVYPASKVFVFVSEGLRSKNNKTRIECVDHIGVLVDRYGIEVGLYTNFKPRISKLFLLLNHIWSAQHFRLTVVYLIATCR